MSEPQDCPGCLGDPDLVCDACGEPSCWAGIYMCWESYSAGGVTRAEFEEAQKAAESVNKTLHPGALKLKVAVALEQAYAGVNAVRVPSPDEVIAEALTTVVVDTHTLARSLANCTMTDTCTAQAVVLRHLADWLAELAREVAEEGAL